MSFPSFDPAAPDGARLAIRNLFQIEAWQEEVPWKPFYPGVSIHRLYGDGRTGPTAALLRFDKGASVPHHLHAGYEHILILAGSQRDRHGPIARGDLCVHAPGTSHAIFSDDGCIVLAIYEKPVVFGDLPQEG